MTTECWRCGAATGNEMLGCYQSRGAHCVQSGLYADRVRAAMAGQRRLYIDLDGVLADFDLHHRQLFGFSRERHTGWDHIAKTPDFFLTMPPMRDGYLLWSNVRHLQPIILTGTPKSVNTASNDKVKWVRKKLGEDVPVICCRAKEKRLYCRPGDILVDDSAEYRPLWEAAGGVWVQHETAKKSLLDLAQLGVL